MCISAANQQAPPEAVAVAGVGAAAHGAGRRRRGQGQEHPPDGAARRPAGGHPADRTPLPVARPKEQQSGEPCVHALLSIFFNI